MDNERGFTLIELLIVLAIMGILVGITALSLNGLISSSEETTMKSEKDQVQTSIDVYQTQKALDDPCCSDDIAAHISPPDQITSGVVFAQFMRRTTKYYYTWAADGESLTVCDDSAGTTCY